MSGDQRSRRIIGDAGTNVHHHLCGQRDIHERVLFPTCRLEAIRSI